MPRRVLFRLGLPRLARQADHRPRPQTWDSLAWGGTIGVAALLAAAASVAIGSWMASLRAIGVIIVALLGVFTAYELGFCDASLMLPTGADVFSPAVR